MSKNSFENMVWREQHNTKPYTMITHSICGFSNVCVLKLEWGTRFCVSLCILARITLHGVQHCLPFSSENCSFLHGNHADVKPSSFFKVLLRVIVIAEYTTNKQQKNFVCFRSYILYGRAEHINGTFKSTEFMHVFCHFSYCFFTSTPICMYFIIIYCW